MKLDEVPQDKSSTYAGHRKVIYAVDEQGHYQRAQSDGWETESYSPRLALAEFEALEREALEGWRAGRLSPLPCLMYRHRLDEPALAQVTGLWRWRVRRHFRPEVYRRLGDGLLARYADAFGLPLETLRRYRTECPE